MKLDDFQRHMFNFDPSEEDASVAELVAMRFVIDMMNDEIEQLKARIEQLNDPVVCWTMPIRLMQRRPTMTEHKPCPLALEGDGFEVVAERCYRSKSTTRLTRISCDCGVSGPWCLDEEDAWDAWDSMPRHDGEAK